MTRIIFMRGALALAGAAGLVPAITAVAWAQEEAAETGGNPLFNIDIGLSIWTIVVFLTLLWVLRRFAWKPILGALEAREKRIEEAIAAAARLRGEAERTLVEHKKQLAQAREQAQHILAESRQAAERLGQELEERARRESSEILERVQREIQREREQAIDALRREAVELALAAASRLLHRHLDSENDRALVLAYLDSLKRESDEARA